MSEATVIAEREVAKPVEKTEKKIKIERVKTSWKPSSQLCKRFNIAEPFGGAMLDEKKQPKKPRFSVFDYLEVSVNTKENFVTPVIIPSKMERPKPMVSQTQPFDIEAETAATTGRLSTKDLLANEMKASKIEWDRVTEPKSVSSEVSKVPTAQRKTSDKNKTELEKKVEEMKSKHPSEKKDLFKAIFDTDSEEDDEDKSDAKQEEEKKEVDAAKIIGVEAHKDIFASVKQSAAEINVLRNTSPPRGIFANLFTRKPVAEPPSEESSQVEKAPGDVEASKAPPKEKTEDENKSKDSTKIIFKPRSERERSLDRDNLYGPQLPSNLHPAPVPSSSEMPLEQQKSNDGKLDEKLLKLLKKSKKEKEIIEQWVEKPSERAERKKKKKDKDKDKKKKSKKHKKEKKRHKDK